MLQQQRQGRVKGISGAPKRQTTLEAFRDSVCERFMRFVCSYHLQKSPSNIEAEPLLSERVTTFDTDDSVREESAYLFPSFIR